MTRVLLCDEGNGLLRGLLASQGRTSVFYYKLITKGMLPINLNDTY